MVLKEKEVSSSARQNWKKLSAVRKFISLAQSTQRQAPAELVIGTKFKIGKKIANGAFGQLRLAKNIVTGEDLAVKLEPVNSKIPQLFLEFEFYKRLGEDAALPKIHYYGKCGRYNAMVLDLLGPNLEDLFNLCGRRFTTKCVLMIGIQLIDRIEKIHDNGLIYRSVGCACLKTFARVQQKFQGHQTGEFPHWKDSQAEGEHHPQRGLRSGQALH